MRVPFERTIFSAVLRTRLALVFVFTHSGKVAQFDTFFSISKKYLSVVGNSLLYEFFVFVTVVSKLYVSNAV
jgi:hypothetical protein